MASTKDKLSSISELKLQIQSIIKNINSLEESQNLQSTALVAVEKQHQLINDTNALFSALELQIQQSKILKKIKKRRNKRRRQKQKKQGIQRFRTALASKLKEQESNAKLDAVVSENSKIDIKTKTDDIGNIANDSHIDDTIKIKNEVFPKEAAAKNEFLQLKNYNHANRYLRTFELLEMLHYARSQDKILTLQFHEQFANLRCVWNNILMENKPLRTQARRIEDQWNETFFGPKEQTYYSTINKKPERERLREFLRICRTWDSYLVRQKKHGSSIPPGWVLPKADATDTWTQYRTCQD